MAESTGLEAVVEVFGQAAVMLVVVPEAVVEVLARHAVMESWVLLPLQMVLVLAAVPQVLPSIAGQYMARHRWQQFMEYWGMTGIKVLAAQAAVMEVFAADNGWRCQTSDTQKSINT